MLLLDTQRDVLLQPLQVVSGIVEKRHTLPILSNVLISRQQQQLSILASDLEIQIRVFLATPQPGDDFSITVSARKLLDIFRALNGNAAVSLESTDHQLQIRAQKSRFNLQMLPAEDFPITEISPDSGKHMQINQNVLKRLIGQVQYSMAQQDIRYYLNGMLLVIDPQQVTVVATDGHRLCLAAETLQTGLEHQEIILPRKTVNELVKLLADDDQPANITFFPGQVRFVVGKVELVSKVIDGKFPDYQRVIPTNHQNIMTVQRTVLQQALQRASILSNEKFRGVRLVLSRNELRVLCNNNEQEEAQEELEVDYTGDALDIGFNVSYLLDVLNQASSETVRCHFSDANSSLLVTLPEDAHFRYVIMPMRI